MLQLLAVVGCVPACCRCPEAIKTLTCRNVTWYTVHMMPVHSLLQANLVMALGLPALHSS